MFILDILRGKSPQSELYPPPRNCSVMLTPPGPLSGVHHRLHSPSNVRGCRRNTVCRLSVACCIQTDFQDSKWSADVLCELYACLKSLRYCNLHFGGFQLSVEFHYIGPTFKYIQKATIEINDSSIYVVLLARR